MFRLVRIEVTLCLAGNSHWVLPFVFLGHGERYFLTDFGSGQAFLKGLYITRSGGIKTLMMSPVEKLIRLKLAICI